MESQGVLYGLCPPIDLAVFRIVLFYVIFKSVNVSSVVWFSQMPKALLFPPWGTGWLPDSVPINETVANTACAMLRWASFTAMIGLLTRRSALLTAMLAVYVLGIPHCFGQVNHDISILLQQRESAAFVFP